MENEKIKDPFKSEPVERVVATTYEDERICLDVDTRKNMFRTIVEFLTYDINGSAFIQGQRVGDKFPQNNQEVAVVESSMLKFVRMSDIKNFEYEKVLIPEFGE